MGEESESCSMLTEDQKKDCLDCNPFEGDFGEQSDRVLSDKIVIARKQVTCGCCFETIQIGSNARKLSAVFDGNLMSYAWCETCCKAMADSWEDEGIAWEHRCSLGNQNRDKIKEESC